MTTGEDDLVGRVLGSRYRVLRQLGRGGMGSVYEAVDVDLDRRVALKVILPELARDAVLIERFRREVMTAAKLNHPNVVQVIDFGRIPGEPPFLVMELLSGRTLVARLKRGRLDPRRAARITMQVLSALEMAHDAGIVHRDLKPENVFLVGLEGGGEVVKLLDFGLAKLMDGEAYSRLTKNGVLVGTPRYAAPEQVKGSRHVDARSDIYAAGVLLYAMLTGRPPFQANLPQLWTDVLQKEPTDPRALVPELPRELVSIVRTAMRKNPAERYSSARAMSDALAAFAHGSRSRNSMPGEASRSLVGPLPAPGPQSRTSMLPLALVFLFLAAAALVLGAGVIALGLASGDDGTSDATPERKEHAVGPKPSPPRAPVPVMMPSQPSPPTPPMQPAPVQPAPTPQPSPVQRPRPSVCDEYQRRACDCPLRPRLCSNAPGNVAAWGSVDSRDPGWMSRMCSNALADAERTCGRRTIQPWRSPPPSEDDSRTW